MVTETLSFSILLISCMNGAGRNYSLLINFSGVLSVRKLFISRDLVRIWCFYQILTALFLSFLVVVSQLGRFDVPLFVSSGVEYM